MSQITFNLPHVFAPYSHKVDNAYALRALLDCQVALNLAYLRRHAVPGLYQSGVTYGRTILWEQIPGMYLPNKYKKPGQKYYNPIGQSGGKKKADCKSLGPAFIAELIHNGYEARPVFRFVERPDSGFLDFHILIQTPFSNTGWVDPSRDLGMGQAEVDLFYGPGSFSFEL